MSSLGQWHPVSSASIPGVSLLTNERSLVTAQSSWSKFKKETRYAGSVRAGVSFGLAKGVRYSVGRSRAVYKDTSGFKDCGSGLLALTTHRLIFIGRERSASLKFAQILQLVAQDDGVCVQLANKPSWHFRLMASEAQRLQGLYRQALSPPPISAEKMAVPATRLVTKITATPAILPSPLYINHRPLNRAGVTVFGRRTGFSIPEH